MQKNLIRTRQHRFVSLLTAMLLLLSMVPMQIWATEYAPDMDQNGDTGITVVAGDELNFGNFSNASGWTIDYYVNGDSGPIQLSSESMGSAGTSATTAAAITHTVQDFDTLNENPKTQGKYYDVPADKVFDHWKVVNVFTSGNSTGHCELQAVFKTLYTITVDATTNGTVTASTDSAIQGTNIDLTVTPAEGYDLDALTVTDTSNAAIIVSGSSFTMPDSDVTVSASFKPVVYTITVDSATNGTVTASTGSAIIGTDITLTVAPAEGYEIDTLTVKDANNGEITVSNSSFTMPASDVTVTASFKALPPTAYSITEMPAENGSVSVSTYSAIQGAIIDLTITPDEGYELDTLIVKDANNNEVAVSGSSFTMPASNVTVGASFKPVVYTITVDSAANGTVTASTGSAIIGTDITLTVTPAEGYELDTLTVKDANDTEVTVSDDSFVMPASDVTVSASFKEKDPEYPPEEPITDPADATEYTIYVEKTGKGDIYINDQIVEGSMTFSTGSVSVVASPAAGYIVKEVTAVASGAATKLGSGKSFSFDMPASDVTITAVFEKEAAEEEDNNSGNGGSSASGEPEFPFDDVPADDWGRQAVEWLWKKGGTEGETGRKYGPNDPTSRGMAATLLYRLCGSPKAGQSPFIDVPETAYFAKAVGWGFENGYIEGTAPEYYRPARYITREEFAAILYRYAKAQGKGFEGAWMYQIGFEDADQISEYAYEPMCWMTMNGVFEGYNDNTVRPRNIITRREAAVMLYRLWKLL